MASLRVALRMSLAQTSSSNEPSEEPTIAPNKKKASCTSRKSGRSDNDKRKLPSVELHRRNQRRATHFETNEEDSNRNGMDALSSLIVDGARVVVITGAGLSCASGIPAFRSSNQLQDDGTIWGRHVESMGTRTAFQKDPLFWYSSFWLQSFAPKHMMKDPSAGHEALSELTNLATNLDIVTQNVDGLQQKTQISRSEPDRLIEAHGRVGLYRCSSDPESSDPCPYSEEKVLHPDSFTDSERETLGHGETMEVQPMKQVPICPHCKEICMPLSLLFDEDYTDHVSL